MGFFSSISRPIRAESEDNASTSTIMKTVRGFFVFFCTVAVAQSLTSSD